MTIYDYRILPEENLELERRMAAVLDKQESVLSEAEGEEVTKH